MSDTIDAGAQLDEAGHHRHMSELRREAFTMALYVSICLLAALTAVSDDHYTLTQTFQIVWGTTLGLAIAHWFAFKMSSRLVTIGSDTKHDAESALAQLSGAVAVALLATIPIMLFPDQHELDATRLVLATFVAVVGYLVARSSGTGQLRSIIYAVAVLVVALGVALIKNYLIGH